MCIDHGTHAHPHTHPSAPSTDTREFAFDSRRRSVDVGGLALALGATSIGDEHMEMGKGWGGWEESEPPEAMYAELLSDMYTQTQTTVNQPVPFPLPSISPATRHRLIDALDSWHFEPHKFSDEEILACTQLLFEALLRVEGMREAVGVTISQLSSFLLHLRQAYRASNSYHNFQHALDVFQATHMYLRAAGAVPPVAILHLPESSAGGWWRARSEIRATWIGILQKKDIFALYIAAVGHDVGHPGFNNMFMKNAQAPLSQVYDHKSALEQMHCAFLLPIMKRHGFMHLLSPSSSGAQSTFKRLLLDTVLATDMGVHKQFMQRFADLMERPHEFKIGQARTLICQALIKCADISNPSRPHTVSQHWSAALASEWASQALLERQLCLPVSVQDSDDPMIEANGQISFIAIFVGPLLEITSVAVPEMKVFVDQCSTNCALWRSRLAELKEKAERTEPNYPPVPYRAVSPPQPQDYLSVFPLSLPPHFLLPLSAASSVVDEDSVMGDEGNDENGMMNMEEIEMTATATPNGRSRHLEDGNSNGVGIRYEDSGSSSSRSASPSPFANSTYSFPPPPASFSQSQAQYQQPLPSITTDGFTTGRPASPIPSDGSPASEGTSPRSEYVPRTPGSTTSAGIGPGPHAHHSHSTSSTASLSSNGTHNGGASPESSIRAAYKLSVRKKKSFHRNSWTPSLSNSNNNNNTGSASPSLASGMMRALFTQRSGAMSADMSPTRAIGSESDMREDRT